jgi:hypothetical protein
VYFCEQNLTLRETSNNTNHLNENENYNEIIEMPFIFNFQTVSTVRHRCQSSLRWPGVVGCRWKVAELVKKTTSVPEMKKD